MINWPVLERTGGLLLILFGSRVWAKIRTARRERATLTTPLFNHGALRARHDAAVDDMHAALANYEQVVLRAFGQVADALEYLDQDVDFLRSEQSAVGTAAENLTLTRESYRVGNSGVLQVLEAQRQSGRARMNGAPLRHVW